MEVLFNISELRQSRVNKKRIIIFGTIVILIALALSFAFIVLANQSSEIKDVGERDEEDDTTG